MVTALPVPDLQRLFLPALRQQESRDQRPLRRARHVPRGAGVAGRGRSHPMDVGIAPSRHEDRIDGNQVPACSRIGFDRVLPHWPAP